MKKTFHEEFKDKIIKLINDENELNKQYILEQINSYSSFNKLDFFYSKLLELFVHMNFNEDEAKEHWGRILENYNFLKGKLRRKIGLRLAIFDYFINLNTILKNPMLIEINIFKEAEKLAMIDGLTGLFNRHFFEIALEKELKRVERFNEIVSIILIDIDNFKLVNDTKGHLFGDEVLITLSKCLKNNSREEDTVCRYGGEEFIIILPETTSNGALNYAERLRMKVKEIEIFKKNKITFSGGIASYPCDGTTSKELINNADNSLYVAKYSGKDCFINSNEEKRRYKRFVKSWKLLYQPVESMFKKQKITETYTQDVSIGGLQFESDDKYEISTTLLFYIILPNNEEIFVNGRIVWRNEIKKKFHKYGVQFFDINLEQIKKIKKQLSDGENNNLN